MKLLLDENVPRPMADIVRILLRTHQVIHVHDLPGWAGTKDIELYEKARVEGFEAVLTNDTKASGLSAASRRRRRGASARCGCRGRSRSGRSR
ncbi:DUF5615 family PIN-like protein [Frankia sp. CcI49]|uniref:DUF5615 family PIN-like protein n=1 Tax=Frankia sp. CcI49 TaxID=1745382 RepID=UPI00241103EC|nr:DUF5615 family PIN-like protein [Frankia sp. CcI49]